MRLLSVVMAVGVVLLSGQSALAQAASIGCNPSPPVMQTGENAGKALFVSANTFSCGNVGTFDHITLEVKEVASGTLSGETTAQSVQGANYTGSVLWDYDSSKSYKMKARLYGTVNNQVVVIAESTWKDVLTGPPGP